VARPPNSCNIASISPSAPGLSHPLRKDWRWDWGVRLLCASGMERSKGKAVLRTVQGNERSDARGPCCAVDLDNSGISLRCLAPLDVTPAARRTLPSEMAIRPRARSRLARANHPVSRRAISKQKPPRLGGGSHIRIGLHNRAGTGSIGPMPGPGSYEGGCDMNG
jgi:hypothetical protein